MAIVCRATLLPKRFEFLGRQVNKLGRRLFLLPTGVAALRVRGLLQRRQQLLSLPPLVRVLVAGDDTLER